jgi:uncharacterized membrane protein YfcA
MIVSGGHWYAFVVVGLGVGLVGGMLGIGGGVLVIPALVFLFGFSQKLAVGTSLAMLLPPIGIFALLRYWPGNVDIRAALLLALGFAVGGYFGGWLANSHLVSERGLRVFFAFFMLYLAGNLLFRSENRVMAGLKTGLIIAGYGVAYAGARLLARRIERRLDVGEIYRGKLAAAPLAPDYEI